VLAIASWQDEVVPLYSALFQGYSHPNLQRQLFIDSSFLEPGLVIEEDFPIQLVSFLINLRNMSISDHLLLVYLSKFLSGSIYGLSEKPHSTIYDQPTIYDKAIQLMSNRTLEERNCKFSGLFKTKSPTIPSFVPFNDPYDQNDYFIPWCLQELFRDPRVPNDDYFFLKKLFRKWKPSSKQLDQLAKSLEPGFLDRTNTDIKNRLIEVKCK
jgi:hypothetical protein